MTNISEWLNTWTGDHCSGGGGRHEFYEIPVTHVLPSGKTLHGYDYTINADGGSILCTTTGNISTILLDGESTIQIGYCESDQGDYMAPANISVSGDIELDPDNAGTIFVSGQGSVTISWVIM